MDGREEAWEGCPAAAGRRGRLSVFSLKFLCVQSHFKSQKLLDSPGRPGKDIDWVCSDDISLHSCLCHQQ